MGIIGFREWRHREAGVFGRVDDSGGVSREIDVEVLPPAGGQGGGRWRQWQAPGCGMLLVWVVVAWGVEVADVLLGGRLDGLGIWPRQMRGLPGVLLSPWLHGGFGHLMANTMAFLGLGLLVLMAEGRRFVGTTLALVVVSGLGTWVIGRPGSVHIGASGLIYGYFGYLLGRAIWERKLGWAVLGVFVGVVYGGMIFGVMPGQGPISWEGHLAGLVAGLWLGWSHVKGKERSS